MRRIGALVAQPIHTRRKAGPALRCCPGRLAGFHGGCAKSGMTTNIGNTGNNKGPGVL
jgi:hypothetical protein